MKKSLLLASAALFAASLSTSAADVVTDTTLTYDFVKAGAPALTFVKANCKVPFYAFEKEGKDDSKRQDYVGLEVDAAFSAASGLPTEWHVWSRNNPRMNSTIYDDGFRAGSDRNIVVDGVSKGSKVVFFYKSTSTDAAKQKLVYASSASSLTKASVNGKALENAVSTISSGDTINIVSADYKNGTKDAGYLAVLAYNGVIVSKVVLIKNDKDTLTYDFAKAGAPAQLANLNRNNNNSGKIFVYESSADGKTDRHAQDFKGYTGDSLAIAKGLPSECHVFQRSNRITQYLTSYGIKVSADKQWAIDGLDADDQVQIFYSTTETDEAKKNIKYATGASTGTVATLGDSKDAIKNGDVIKSGDVITITSATMTDNKGNLNGAIAFQAYKNMLIEKVVITKRTASTAAGIQDVAVKAANANATVYNLAGQKVGADYKGVVIKNGKKFVQK